MAEKAKTLFEAIVGFLRRQKANSSPDIRRERVEFNYASAALANPISLEWVNRPWGRWCVLAEHETFKLKELVVNPHCALSCQKHLHRSEYWIPKSGFGILVRADANAAEFLEPGMSRKIEVGTWHQLSNPTTKPLHIIEIQFGERCAEDDIERYQYE